MRIRSFLACGVTVMAFLACVSPASAQRAVGPYSDLLGATEDSNVRHTLMFRSSFFGAWDEVKDETINPAVDDRFLRIGPAGGANGSLTHARRTRRNDWLSSASSALRAYGTGDDDVAATFAGRTQLNSTFNTRVSLLTSAGFGYSPYYEFAPSLDSRFMSAGPIGGGFGVATAAQRNAATDADATLTVRLSRRDTFDVYGNGRHYDFLDQPGSDLTWYGGRATFRHLLTRSLSIRAGYGREQSEYESPVTPQLTSDTIDVGIDYGDTFQFSRRTALSFSSSTSAVRWLDDTHYRLNATIALTQAFGRSGSGSVRYTRDTDFTPGFREPLLTDTVGGGYSNQVGRRSAWFANMAYTRGSIGFDSNSSTRYDVYSGGGRWTTAMTRHLGVFGDYSYYRYEVPAGATFFTFLPKFQRHSVSVGLSVWAPLINDTRTPPNRPQ